MDQNTNLSGMGQDDAKRYILAHMTDLNLLKQKIKAVSADLDMWKSRVALAESKALPDLKASAEAQVSSIAANLAALGSEAQALERDIETMRSQLPGLAARERRIDPDRLEVELQMATGEFDHPGQAAVEREVKATEADDALAKLKASLGMGPAAGSEASTAKEPPAARESAEQAPKDVQE
jgi:phage shock protein A